MTNDNQDALRCADALNLEVMDYALKYDTALNAQHYIRSLVAENEAQTKQIEHLVKLPVFRKIANLEAENEAQAALLRQAVEAATAAKQALDDWLTVYAEEFHSAEQVQQANDRIFNSGGTIWYVADTVKMQTDAIAAIRQHLEGKA